VPTGSADRYQLVVRKSGAEQTDGGRFRDCYGQEERDVQTVARRDKRSERRAVCRGALGCWQFSFSLQWDYNLI
jgi:hypothetical protein